MSRAFPKLHWPWNLFLLVQRFYTLRVLWGTLLGTVALSLQTSGSGFGGFLCPPFFFSCACHGEGRDWTVISRVTSHSKPFSNGWKSWGEGRGEELRKVGLR